MKPRIIRMGTVGIVVTALVALGAATASASTSMAPSLRLRAQALQRARLLPRGFFSLTTVYLQTAPVDVVRNGVTYSMSLSVIGDPGFGSSVDVGLGRVQGDGRAFQSHDYSFSPQSGINFRYDRKTLETATLDTTTAISPSHITGSFAATSVKSKACRLYDGRMGTKLTAKGTMTWSAFDVVTSTAPFFGTIHTQPTAATIVKDPGCESGIIVFSGAANSVRAIPKVGAAVGGSAYRERGERPCFLNRALGAKVGPGRFFGFEKAYRTPEIFELGLRQRQVPPDESEFHFIEAFARPGTLPKPAKVGPGRFEAAIRSEGGEFMNGSATFVAGAPTVRTGLVCRAGSRLRHFTRLTYRGTLEPAVPPLLAAFDTLPLAVREGTQATYVVRDYGLR
jgi:hypothetical protein